MADIINVIIENKEQINVAIEEILPLETIYLTKRGPAGIPGPIGPIGPSGPNGITPNLLSTWNILTQYNYFDMVNWTSVYQGGEGTPSGWWLAVADPMTLGSEPGDNSNEWKLIVQNGYQGIEGAPGTGIVISDTAPENPVLNQLWLEI